MSASVGTLERASWEWRPTGVGPIGSLGCLSRRPVLGSILAVPGHNTGLRVGDIYWDSQRQREFPR